MCGIAGYFGSFPPALLGAMTQRLSHRGPDDEGTFFTPDRSLGLGHRRLSIIDLSAAGHQPMTDASGRFVICYNGEIYNYRELRDELRARGVQFRSESDTELLVELFAREGLGCLPRLNGIFAFGIWDTLTRELTLVRDGLGIKPLYYACLPQGCLFASELKALCAASELPRDLDHDALSYYLTYLWAPAPHTPLRAVRKLEPGHWIVIREGGKRARSGQFFDLPAPSGEEIGTDDAISLVRSTIDSAIKRQLVADVPVGAFLSGGLDSSMIACFASRHMPGPLTCFTIRYDDKDRGGDGLSEDLPYAQRVARHLGVDLHEVRVSPDIAHDLPWMVQQLDEPQADPACLNAYYICREARARGLKVLLSGAGGDDLFTGYRRHVAVAYEHLWSWLPRPIRRGLARAAQYTPQSRPAFRRAAKAFAHAGLEGDERLISYFYWTAPDITARLLGAEIDVAAPLRAALNRRADLRSPLARMLYLESKFFLGDHNLGYTDKMSMACGVEVRVPLVDMEVVSCAARISSSLKQRGREGKWILKKAMEPDLPHDVIYRPKTGFGVPLRSWMAGALRPMMDELLSHSALTKQGIFDPEAVQRLRSMTEANTLDGSYTLLAVACMTLWIESFARSADLRPDTSRNRPQRCA